MDVLHGALPPTAGAPSLTLRPLLVPPFGTSLWQVRDNLQALTFVLSDAEVDELEFAAKGAKKATQNIFQTS